MWIYWTLIFWAISIKLFPPFIYICKNFYIIKNGIQITTPRANNWKVSHIPSQRVGGKWRGNPPSRWFDHTNEQHEIGALLICEQDTTLHHSQHLHNSRGKPSKIKKHCQPKLFENWGICRSNPLTNLNGRMNLIKFYLSRENQPHKIQPHPAQLQRGVERSRVKLD